MGDVDVFMEAAKSFNAKELRDTFSIIDETRAIAINKKYRNLRCPEMPRTADVDMALFGLSLKAWPINNERSIVVRVPLNLGMHLSGIMQRRFGRRLYCKQNSIILRAAPEDQLDRAGLEKCWDRRFVSGISTVSALIFAQSVMSPQNWGGVSAAATDLKISPGVLLPARIAFRARCSSRPNPVTGSGRSCSQRWAAAGTG